MAEIKTPNDIITKTEHNTLKILISYENKMITIEQINYQNASKQTKKFRINDNAIAVVPIENIEEVLNFILTCTSRDCINIPKLKVATQLLDTLNENLVEGESELEPKSTDVLLMYTYHVKFTIIVNYDENHVTLAQTDYCRHINVEKQFPITDNALALVPKNKIADCLRTYLLTNISLGDKNRSVEFINSTKFMQVLCGT